MISRVYGLLGHKQFTANAQIINTAILGFYILIVLIIRRISLGDGIILIIPGMFVLYTLVLISVNIGSYKLSQNLDLAIQGRYWFPVLLPLIIYTLYLYNNYLTKHNIHRKLIIGIMVIFSLRAGLPNIVSGIQNNGWLRDDLKTNVGRYL